MYSSLAQAILHAYIFSGCLFSAGTTSFFFIIVYIRPERMKGILCSGTGFISV